MNVNWTVVVCVLLIALGGTGMTMVLATGLQYDPFVTVALAALFLALFIGRLWR